MTQVQILPPAAKFLKKLKDKKLKSLYKEAIEMICEDYSIGEEKTGDLAGMYGYDIYYNKTNYELAYRVRQLDDLIIIIIMAGTRENFYEELKRYIYALYNSTYLYHKIIPRKSDTSGGLFFEQFTFYLHMS